VRLEAPESAIDVDVDVRVRHCTAREDVGRYSIGVELMQVLPSAFLQRDDPVSSDSTPAS